MLETTCAMDDGGEPLARVPWPVWVHVVIGGVAGMFVLPFGLGLGRVGERAAHRTVQTTGLVAVLVTLVFALSTGTEADGNKLHALVGLFSAMALVMQAVLGLAVLKMERRRGDEEPRRAAETVHAVLGTVVVGLLAFVEPALGVTALLGVCNAAAEDSCIGHGSTAACCAVAGAAYTWMSRRNRDGQTTTATTPVHVYAGELLCVAFAALLSIAYSVYDEWPYATAGGRQHLAMSLIVFAAVSGGLWHMWQRHTAAAATTTVWIRHGVTLGLAAVATGISFAWRPQHTNYGRVMHAMFGTLLALAGVARVARLFSLLAALCWMAAAVIYAGQPGLQVLYAAHYRAHIGTAWSVIVAMAVGLVLYAYTVWWLTNFAEPRPRETIRPVTGHLVLANGDLARRVNDLVRD